MSDATQMQAIATTLQRLSELLSDTVSMALEGCAVSQAQGKKFLESALELAATSTKESVRYTEELRSRFTDAINTANRLLKEQAAQFKGVPSDPVAATQQVIAGQIEGSRKALEVGAEALKSYVNLLNDFWSRLEKASQETRENYVDFVGKLQAIVEATVRKS
jgi:hypothetical protein